MDADPIYRGIVKEVYTPFSVADDYRLIGASEEVKQKYLDYYRRIDLNDLMNSVFLQFYKYANVYVYLLDNGQLITLPVNLCRIANIQVRGEPVVELNCRSIRDDLRKQGVLAKKNWVEDEDLGVRLKGFPPEVAQALREGKDWVQLNPANTYVMQDLKEDWTRYAVPMVASCLKAFAKKELISNWENSLLNLGARSFVHVQYGDPSHTVLPTLPELTAVNAIFRKAMTGSALATTNNWAKAYVVQPKTDDLYQFDKYKGVNADILSAGGISGIIVSGRAEDGSTFASAQVSMQTAAIRIKQAKDAFCLMMDKINARLNSGSAAITHSSPDKVPKFTFPPVDLTGNEKFQATCLKLWKEGVLSNETMLQIHGYDMRQEKERLEKEKRDGIFKTFEPPKSRQGDSGSASSNVGGGGNSGDDEVTIGRPTMDDSERHSDPAQSITGRQPKGSNPDGSEAQV